MYIEKNIMYSAFFILAFVLGIAGYGQSANDNIRERSKLILDDEYTSSSTREATVEWNCINKSLTNRCLTYHNDQWFSFSVARPGKYYLNISSQFCKDDNGIQAIVIEGNPCEINTYKVLQCIPRIRQQDIYIEFDFLKTNVSYLVNIDGFLGDYCTFDIQLSSRASGFSHIAENLDTLDLLAQTKNGIATLTWKLPDEFADDLHRFEVHRYLSGGKKSVLIKSLPPNLNSLGLAQKEYSLIDTLPSDNSFTYEIAGLLKDGRKVLLDLETVNVHHKVPSTNQHVLDFTLEYKDGTDLQILLINKSDGRVLRQSSFPYNKVLDTNQRIFVGEYVKAGIFNFIVRVVNVKAHQKTDLAFLVSPDGVVLEK